MNIGWIPMILLSLCFSSAAKVIISHIFDDLVVFQVYGHPGNRTISVPCPNLPGMDSKEMTYTLRLGDLEVGNHTYDTGKNYTETVREGLRLRVNQTDLTVQFVVSGTTVKHASVYTCKVRRLFPPPIEDLKEYRTVVLVQDYQSPPENIPDSGEVWVWKLAFWIIVIYGLAVTLIAFVSYIRLRKKESSHSDYMNTRPRAPPRVLKKKHGVQHPVRMGRY
ncbi:hypothetical protein DPEC_G00156350 [Dallia pectoralis]|uniref:Uncharacterized protein n=1 Tax=Dallia pectoralis TaxID=75939 RepID=A0ACC2GKR5_DALPE|nr:hypothetical protein DPEC_G00156350 [Dallia pectoralis]